MVFGGSWSIKQRLSEVAHRRQRLLAVRRYQLFVGGQLRLNGYNTPPLSSGVSHTGCEGGRFTKSLVQPSEQEYFEDNLMSLQSLNRSWSFFRLIGAVACLALFASIGCFDMNGGAGGGGCAAMDGGGNDNVVDNDNMDGENDNSGAGNDNVVENENTGGGNANLNENENDNTGGGTGGNDNGGSTGNDNTSTGGNDNEEPSDNDNTPAGNDNGTANVNDNASGNTNANANDNGNTNSNMNVNSNSSGGGGTMTVPTRGDAVRPGETAELRLGESVPQSCVNNAQWVQASPATPMVVITGPNMDGAFTFMAPTVTTTTTFTFNVTTIGCSAGTMGTARVEVQIAEAVWDQDGIDALPDCIEVGCAIDLDAFFDISLQPVISLPLYSVLDVDASVASINQTTGTLTLNDSDGVTSLTILGQVFGAAGLLDEAMETIDIVADCSTCP
jgi:hypothetical protein